MKALVTLAPLALGLVIFAVVVGFLVQRQSAVGAWLFAAFLLGHGLVHIMFAAPPPSSASTPGAEFAFDVSRSWVVTGHLADVTVVRAIVIALVVVAVAGYGLAAMATVGLAVPSSAWPVLVVAATAASSGLMVVGLAPALVLGAAIDVVLFLVVVSSVWTPGREPLA
jgi:hypothetical protein